MNWKPFLLLACVPLVMGNDGGCTATPAPTSSQQAAIAVESNQQRLLREYPAPQLPNSLERANLIKRLTRINAQNMSGFIYLIDHGVVMASYPVAGKITSLNSYLASSKKTIEVHVGGGSGPNPLAEVEQPDFDGVYGENDDGIFFFTADTDAYVEWHGEYLFSDQPLKLNQQPAMLRIIDNK